MFLVVLAVGIFVLVTVLAPVGNIGARDSRDACGRCEAIR